MTWNLSWEGRATDFVPDLLKESGKPGRIARAARGAIWEAVQALGEADPHAWVQATANGWETPQEPGLGQMSLTIVSKAEPSEVEQDIREQQPVDLLASSGGSVTPPAPGPADSA